MLTLQSRRLRAGEKRPGLTLLILTFMLLLLCFISIPIGNGGVGFAEAYHVLLKKLLGQIPVWWGKFSSSELFQMGFFKESFTREETVSKLLLQYYLPRTAGAVLVGASLSSAGAVYQGIFRNPLVAPDLLGASSGAAFGGALAIYCGWGGFNSIALAFGMGLLAVAIVYLVSFASREDQALTMLLAGTMVSSLFHAGITFMKTFTPSDGVLPSITFWLLGAVSPGFKASQLQIIWIPVVAGLLILFLARWKINLATLGEDEAKTIGISPVVVRGICIFAATLVTSACVSICGAIGWVGLIVPHFVRRLVGPDYRVLLPASILAGGMLVLLLDDIALQGNPITPLGVLVGFVGVPFYLILLMDRRQSL